MRFVFGDLAHLAAPESLSSAADRARPGHIRCAREYPRATPATRLQTHFAGARRRRIFLFAIRRQAFHGPAIPDGCPRKSYCRIRSANGCPENRSATAGRARMQISSPACVRRITSKAGIAITASPTQFGARTRIFIAPRPLSRAATASVTALQKLSGRSNEIRQQYTGSVGELDVSEIPHIFFRAQQRIGAAT